MSGRVSREKALSLRLQALAMHLHQTERRHASSLWLTSGSGLDASDSCKRDIFEAGREELKAEDDVPARLRTDAMLGLAQRLDVQIQTDDSLESFATLFAAVVAVRVARDALTRIEIPPTTPGHL